ncbi:MAG: hypothetical protein HRT66_05040 [Flavobacteriaceae bacterium]|nr:hypothetical protein [Flavobacteriaceae bacterium]
MYSDSKFPSANTEVLTVNYYDKYKFKIINDVEIDTIVVYGINDDGSDKISTIRIKGLATGSKVEVIGTDKWITTTTYYDSKARPIYTKSINEYLDTQDIVITKLDFVGKLMVGLRYLNRK